MEGVAHGVFLLSMMGIGRKDRQADAWGNGSAAAGMHGRVQGTMNVSDLV